MAHSPPASAFSPPTRGCVLSAHHHKARVSFRYKGPRGTDARKRGGSAPDISAVQNGSGTADRSTNPAQPSTPDQTTLASAPGGRAPGRAVEGWTGTVLLGPMRPSCAGHPCANMNTRLDAACTRDKPAARASPRP